MKSMSLSLVVLVAAVVLIAAAYLLVTRSHKPEELVTTVTIEDVPEDGGAAVTLTVTMPSTWSWAQADGGFGPGVDSPYEIPGTEYTFYLPESGDADPTPAVTLVSISEDAADEQLIEEEYARFLQTYQGRSYYARMEKHSEQIVRQVNALLETITFE